MTRRLLSTVALLSALPLMPMQAGADPLAIGARNGPFVVTERSLGELLHDRYEIRGNLGTALILQKDASVFSCAIPPDPERLSYKPYFVCSELREESRPDAASAAKPALQPGAARP
jgi:hypothetical protein